VRPVSRKGRPTVGPTLISEDRRQMWSRHAGAANDADDCDECFVAVYSSSSNSSIHMRCAVVVRCCRKLRAAASDRTAERSTRRSHQK